MKPKRLISLLVAVCMMITMLPLSAVTAFAADTSTEQEASYKGYKYAYTVNGGNATITKFLGPDDSANPVDSASTVSYDIEIPEKLGGFTVTGLGKDSFTGYPFAGDWYIFGRNIHSVTIPQSVTSIGDSAFSFCIALTEVTIPQSVTSIGDKAFLGCEKLDSLTINDAATSIGKSAFAQCYVLSSLSLGKKITTIGDHAFFDCRILDNVTIPQSVTSIADSAFGRCYQLKTLSLGENIETIGERAFDDCWYLTNVTIPKNVKTIGDDTFRDCHRLKYIMLPAELTSFQDKLIGCPAKCVIYYNNDEDNARDRFGEDAVGDNATLAGHKLLYLCKVTFDANGGSLTGYDEVLVYRTEKITDTMANDLKANDPNAIKAPTRAGYKFTGWYTEDDQPFDVDNTAITKDITLHAGWEFDPNAPGYRPLTVTGGTVTVKYDGSDVTSKLNSKTDAATGQKTYSVPEGATVTVTLDKTAVPNGKVFDGWSTSLPTGQDCKAESITFPMSSGVNVSAKYRDAATDHTPDTAVCHPLTVTGGIVTVKNGDKDVTDTLTVTTDETPGKKTYSVPDGATVTVTLDKNLIPEGMVFDIWSTGKFSLPLGQDYKAESITFTMNTMSSDADIAAQYRDATIEDDGPNVLGTAAIIGTAAVGGAVLGYQAYSLGTEFAGKLMALPYFPSNRSALAMMLWEDAGKPMPESELLYPDVEQEEQDMDLQHAARWAMENELIPDLNDEGTAPEEMKFFPANPVSKLDVLNAWQKAQELKNN